MDVELDEVDEVVNDEGGYARWGTCLGGRCGEVGFGQESDFYSVSNLFAGFQFLCVF